MADPPGVRCACGTIIWDNLPIRDGKCSGRFRTCVTCAAEKAANRYAPNIRDIHAVGVVLRRIKKLEPFLASDDAAEILWDCDLWWCDA